MIQRNPRAPGIEYGIVHNDDLASLVREVNEAIAEGWVPIGGHMFVDRQSAFHPYNWSQAMVREREVSDAST